MTNKEIVDKTSAVLNENPEWAGIYKDYAKAIRAKQKEYVENGKKIKPEQIKPIQVYSSIDHVKKGTYDLRFAGQSIGEITVDKETGNLQLHVDDEKAARTKKYFGFEMQPLNVEWAKEDAETFIDNYRKLSIGKVNVYSEKRKIESLILEEFAKTSRAEGKKLCNIQPVRLCEQFYQLTTPLAECSTDPTISITDGKASGVGIDILARITTKSARHRLVIIELENKQEGSDVETMFKALAKATFIAHLLRSNSGKDWWELFEFNFTNPVKDTDQIDLYVVTLMPKGSSKEGEFEEIPVKGKNVTMHPCTLYYETDEEGNITEINEGTLLDEIMA